MKNINKPKQPRRILSVYGRHKIYSADGKVTEFIMMTEPGITKLDKCVDSRYTLAIMTAKRARMIGKAMHDGLTDNDGEKPVSTAVNEIADGRVGYVRSEEIRKAKEWEEEKFAAIQHLSEDAEAESASENTNGGFEITEAVEAE